MSETVASTRFCSSCGAAGAGAFCPACGVATDAHAPQVARAAAPKAPSLGWTIIKGLTICAAIVGLFVATSGAGGSSSSSSVPMPGTLSTLARECTAAPTKDAFEQFSTSLRQGDRAGAVQLVMAGGGLFLPKGTSVMAKDWSFPDIEEVSVQTPGDHFGERLFLSWECATRGAK